jgi:hypothetical protein
MVSAQIFLQDLIFIIPIPRPFNNLAVDKYLLRL